MTRLLITYPMCAKLIREIIIIAAEVLLEKLWEEGHKTLQVHKLLICSYGQFLTVNLLVNCKHL